MNEQTLHQISMMNFIVQHELEPDIFIDNLHDNSNNPFPEIISNILLKVWIFQLVLPLLFIFRKLFV